MKKMLATAFLIIFLLLVAACNDENMSEAGNDSDVLITFQDKTITEFDVQNASLYPDQDIHEVAKSVLFHEIVLVEADAAGTSYDEYDLMVLVDQTLQLYEFDEEAVAFITEKSELNNLEPMEYIETVWKDYLRTRLIVNNHLDHEIGFAGKSDEEVAAAIANFEDQLLTKYEEDIEYHF
ncbi:putative small secreted protein [Evansella vedderi]|uniref:Small secreted protein n=1 Tax=Evansella vedderi TaxID=38282 RepID=A0ABT9ZX54_9BACI|nr:hypothetical protein [Evansella vedderi]MDQ0255814.1 putative small secreted protein [Evansella vedderi]